MNPSVIQEAITQGVKQGLFGLGELIDDGASVACRYFKENAIVEFGETEVIVKDSVCSLQKQSGEPIPVPFPVGKPESQGPTITTPPEQAQEHWIVLRLNLRFPEEESHS